MKTLSLLTLMSAIFMLLLLPASASAQFGGSTPTVPSPRLLLATTAINIDVPGGPAPGPGALAVATLKFGNTGQANLHWRAYFGSDYGGCAVESGIRWISVAPASGIIAPNRMAAAQISVTALPNGSGPHSALLCLATNDPNAAHVAIPVTVYVQ